TTTGLCTQVNTGFHVANPAFAAEYLEQWKRLRDAGDAFPDAGLVTPNSSPKPVTIGASHTTIWFSRTHGEVDLAALDEVVAAAKHAILFLMCQPGTPGPLGAIQKRLGDPGLYVRGVVSNLPPESTGKRKTPRVAVTTFGEGGRREPLELDVVEPQGL